MQKLRTNWRAWPFFGLVTGLLAMAGMTQTLTWEYKHVIVTKNIDGTKFRVRHGVDAFGPDALIIVGLVAVLALLVGVSIWISHSVNTPWQVFGLVWGTLVIGIAIGAWLLNRIVDAEFNAQEAWLGFACAAIMVVAILANHLFYHDRN